MKCVAFASETFTRYGSNITNVWQEILTPMTLIFSCEVVHKKLWKTVSICKSYGEKISGTFFIWTRCSDVSLVKVFSVMSLWLSRSNCLDFEIDMYNNEISTVFFKIILPVMLWHCRLTFCVCSQISPSKCICHVCGCVAENYHHIFGTDLFWFLVIFSLFCRDARTKLQSVQSSSVSRSHVRVNCRVKGKGTWIYIAP